MTVLGAIAQFERERIAERVRAGLARAKAQGKRLGRPPGTKDHRRRLAPAMTVPRAERATDGESARAHLRGYQAFSFRQAVGPYNEWAYASLGDRIGDTRFFFADAAAQDGVWQLDQSPEVLSARSNGTSRTPAGRYGI